MAKITRKVAKIFGSSSGFQQVAQFGSLAAAAPIFTTDVATIQNLANWLTGWFGAVIGGNSPAIEDMNAFCYVMAYQISYLMQAGVPEWETNTIYYKGSLAQSGGQVFVSTTDSNTGNAVTDSTNWLVRDAATVNLTQANTGYTLTSTNKWEKTALVNTSSGATTVNLPQASTCKGARLTVIKTTGDVSQVTIAGTGGDLINGLASVTCDTQYAALDFVSTGTGWIVV